MTRAFTPMAGILRRTGTDLGSGAPLAGLPRPVAVPARAAAAADGTGGGAQRCSSALTPMTSSPAPISHIAAMISHGLPVSPGSAGGTAAT
jgi:hypothetical protein